MKSSSASQLLFLFLSMLALILMQAGCNRADPQSNTAPVAAPAEPEMPQAQPLKSPVEKPPPPEMLDQAPDGSVRVLASCEEIADCLEVGLRPATDLKSHEGLRRFLSIHAANAVEHRTDGVEIYRVSTRDVSGHERLMELTVEYIDHACGSDWIAALLGVSEEGFPIVQTDVGFLEILVPDWRPFYVARHVRSEATGDLLRELIMPFDSQSSRFHFKADGGILLSDTSQGCFEAMDTGPFKVHRLPPSECDVQAGKPLTRVDTGLTEQDTQSAKGFWEKERALVPEIDHSVINKAFRWTGNDAIVLDVHVLCS